MSHHKVLAHFIPHKHEDGSNHGAHALSLPALFSYLQILLVLIAGLYFIRYYAPHILGTASFSADQIVTLTNAKRQEAGLPILSPNSALAQAAVEKSSDMIALDYWAHSSPSGKTPWSFIAAAGYRYIYAGENLARDFNDAASVVAAWMNSPSHRSNLLDGNFKEIGVAVTSGRLGGREGTLVVQMFGARISQIPSQQPLAVVSPSPGPVSQVAETSPAPSPLSTPLPSASPQFNPSQQATVLASRQFSIAKGASLFLLGFVFLLFAVETVITTRREDFNLRAGIIAHLGLLGFVLLAVWYAVSGAII